MLQRDSYGAASMSEAQQADIEAAKAELAAFYHPLNRELYHLLRLLGYNDFPPFESDQLVDALQ